MKRARLLFAAVVAACVTQSVAQPVPRIAIIIDDLGYHLAAGRRAIALPGPIAYAILPGAPRSQTLASAASGNGKEVLLHLPMQAVAPDNKAEPKSMTLDMSRARFAETFTAALGAVPQAIGVNNHRGSLLTRHPGHMRWLMEELRAREQLFFVDSFTTHHSVAVQLASENGVMARKRDVFLDPDRSTETVMREFERLKSLARKRGSAVAIGHPYEATLTLLERELPLLAEQGYRLVPISELVASSEH